MEQAIRQMAEALKKAANLQDVAGFGFQLVDDAKRMEGVTPEQSAEIDKKAAELQTKTNELKDVRNSYQ
jgi:hypothetical protein